MSSKKPLVAVAGRARQLPGADNLSVPTSVVVDGSVVVGGRALPGWGATQADRVTATWTGRTIAAIQYNSICWAPELGIFCAVGNTVTPGAATSPDGVTWTTRTTPTNMALESVCWSPELRLFCAVARSGTGPDIITSPDGVTWTSRTAPVSGQALESVCWSPQLGLFCAVASTGTGNRVITSPDGVTWTSRTSAANNTWSGVCWAPELQLFCAVAQSAPAASSVMTSPDGITWTARTAPVNTWEAVCWAPEIGTFCAVASALAANLAMTSTDGINWTSRTPSTLSFLRDITWAPQLGIFLTVATGTGNKAAVSPDGINWTSKPMTAAMSACCWSPELASFALQGNGVAVSSTPAEPPVYAATNAVYFPSIGTTASAGNAFLNSASIPGNQLLRSTSSLRYKTDIEDMEAVRAQAALQLRPVSYRSLADADDKDVTWYGLIAEEVATVETRLVHYTPSGEPDGVQYERLSALLLKLVQEQQSDIDRLEQAIKTLESST